jgi:hypothetical protein
MLLAHGIFGKSGAWSILWPLCCLGAALVVVAVLGLLTALRRRLGR